MGWSTVVSQHNIKYVLSNQGHNNVINILGQVEEGLLYFVSTVFCFFFVINLEIQTVKCESISVNYHL